MQLSQPRTKCAPPLCASQVGNDGVAAGQGSRHDNVALPRDMLFPRVGKSLVDNVSDSITEEGSYSENDEDSGSSSSGDSSESTSLGCTSERLNTLLSQLWNCHVDKDNAGIVQALQNLALFCGTSSGRRHLLYSGGHLLLLHVLTDHLPQREVQTAAFMALMTLCVSHTARSLIASSSMGGIASILTSMKYHVKDCFLQVTGCGILVQLCQQAENCDTANSVKSLIVSCNGIPIVLGAVTRFPDVERLQRYACSLLDNLAMNANYKPQLVVEGAITVLSGVMRRFHDNPQVFDQAQAAYSILLEEADTDLYEL